MKEEGEREGRNSWFELGGRSGSVKRDSCDPNISKGSAMIYGQCSLDFYDRWKIHPFLFERRNKLDLTIRCTSFRLKTILSCKIR